MNLAADMGRHSGRATPSLHDRPYRQIEETTGRRSTYPSPIPVQTNPATSNITINPVITHSGFGKKDSESVFYRTRGVLVNIPSVGRWPLEGHDGHGSYLSAVLGLDARQSLEAGNPHQPPRPDTNGFNLTAGYQFGQFGLADCQRLSGFSL